MSGDEPTPAHLNPDTDGPEWSNITINGERQTWQALYEAEKERRQKSDEWRTLVNDLDRCEHGRHQADVCSSCGGPSRGNPLLPTGTVIGTTLHAGQRIVVPERTERNRIEAWFAAATPAPVTPPTADERGPWCCYADEAGVYEAGICSPDDPIHAPTHCGYDNVRRGLVPAPPTVTDTDTMAVPRAEWEALAEAVDKASGRMAHRWMVPIGDRAVALIGASRRAAAGVSDE